MPLSLKPLVRLTTPLLLLLAAAYTLSKTDLLAPDFIEIAKWLPYAVFFVVLGLAHFFNRSRYFVAALVMAIVFWLIQNYLQNTLSDDSSHYIFYSLNLLAPLAIVLLMLLPERGLWNRHSLIPLSIVPLLFAVSYFFQQHISAEQLHSIDILFTLKPIDGYVMSVNASLWCGGLMLLGLLLLAHRNAEAEAALWGCLLFCYITLAFFDRQLISTVMFAAAGLTLIISLLRSSHDMAYRDDLTGLLGRRALNEKMRGLGRSYVMAMMDVDHFKKFNDTHGHDVGDDVLKIVAANIAEVSGGGIPYRYGGEEFAIVFTGKKLKQCVPHLEAVREAIADYPIILRDKKSRPRNAKKGAGNRGQSGRQKTVSVTISIGVAERGDSTDSADGVLKAADKALYSAKEAGRNCLRS